MGLEFENFLERCSFGAHAGRDLVCGVSGGPDSAALLALACRFVSERGSAVTAVHVDHGIRADGSVEAAHVAALCDRIGAGLRIVRLELSDGPNLQARAREARQAALGPDAMLGHTADDQAETVLLQLMRGGSVNALAGMRAGRRPLLGLRRSDTERICELVEYEPIRDPSNTDRRYLRTRVRHELIPLLCEIAGRDVVPLLARSAELAAADAELLDGIAADVDPTNANELTAAPVALARRAIRAWLRTPYPTRHPPDAAAVQRVLEVARGVHRATEVSGGRRVIRSAGELRIDDADAHNARRTG